MPTPQSTPSRGRPPLRAGQALLVVLLAGIPLAPLAAQEARPSPGVRATFGRALPPLRVPLVLRSPWAGAGAGERSLGMFERGLATAIDSARAADRLALRYLTIYGTPLAVTAQGDKARVEERGLLGIPVKYADLSIEGLATLEMRTERFQNHTCDAVQLLQPNSGCDGTWRAPRLDNTFNLRTSGVIGQRVHLNVDFDTDREFSAANTVLIYYQGLEDEIVRRVDVGSVVFRPPPSRFLTAAIPTNNFGVNATFQVGALELQTLYATQSGSVADERTYVVGATSATPQDRTLRDLDYEPGRFYWTVDPAGLAGYPSVDILTLDAGAVPTSQRPVQVQLYRYRPATAGGNSPTDLSGITAVAIRPDSDQRAGPLRWELLLQGSDYYLDPSGLWVMLGTKLDQGDYLAVSYQTADGGRVGTLPVADDPARADTLLLIVDPLRGQEVPTFRYEMRQVYRVAGTDLDRQSLQAELSVNNSEQPQSGQGTYLSLLGMATANNEELFDRQNRLFPRLQDAGAAEISSESYIIFPHLEPFGDETLLAPGELNDSLYRTPRYLVTSPQGPPSRFTVRLEYNAAGGGDRSLLSLNALQVVEESEQIFVQGRRLQRGVDYSISYELGQVTFLDPDGLFPGGATEVRVRFEERGTFSVAPNTIYGFTGRYSFGRRGYLDMVGLYQAEQTVFNRPTIGFEPTANLVGGLRASFTFRPDGVTRFLDGIVSGSATAPSRLDLDAEFAFSKPDPNRAGQAFLEDFEANAGLQVSLRETIWRYGSRPQSPEGLTDIGFGAGLDSADAVPLTWQNLIPGPGGQAVELTAQDIDPNIQLQGRSNNPETVMYLRFHADTAGGIVQQDNSSEWTQPARPFQPRWRTLVTPISTTGADLSRNEFLEFWVFQSGAREADSAGIRLLFDIGTVSEDALAIAPTDFTVNGTDTTFTGRQYVGPGRLDTERTPSGVFNASVDDIGILGDRPDQLDGPTGPVLSLPLCERTLTNSVPVYPWGDLSALCSNGNGALDTEDLNNDNILDARGSNENVFRYVVDLRDGRYFVRDGVSSVDPDGRVSKWSLYRVPVRAPDHVIGTPNLRLVQHLRLTVAAPPDDGGDDITARFALARVRFLGSTWSRRTDRVLAGISGEEPIPTGEVAVSVISTEDAVYESPPGVGDQSERKDGSQDTQGVQTNEKSLRLIGLGLAAGERAEAFYRFPAGAQNLLKYREMRVWVRGNGSGWNEGDFEVLLKVGADPDNFYMYRAPARSDTWEPEVVIDLDRWRALRGETQNRWLQGEPPGGAAECGGGDPEAYVACDGPYVVHVRDPAVSPPNLAAVQEVSAAIYRVSEGTAVADAELWVDEIRMTSPISEVGTAMAVDARLIASDVGDLNLSVTRQGGQFRQIARDPTYRTTTTMLLGGSTRLERFFPSSLGIALPVTVSFAQANVAPELVAGTDLRASDLEGLRSPSNWTASMSASLRRTARGGGWLMEGLVNPLAFSANIRRGATTTELSEGSQNAMALGATYRLQRQRTGPTLPLGGVVDALPGFMKNGELGSELRASRLTLAPTNIRFTSALSRNQSDRRSFAVPVTRPDDELIRPLTALTHLWTNSAGLTWQPLGMLLFNTDYTVTRDLREYDDSTTIGVLAGQARESFLGLDIGAERDRNLATSLVIAPQVSSWFRPRISTSSSFVLSRSLFGRAPVRVDGDSGAFILPQTINNSRSRDLGANIDLGRLVANLSRDSSLLRDLLGRIRPVDVIFGRIRGSTYDLATFDPSLGYQLALGGFDSFLYQGDEQAIGASETDRATITGGADLPMGFEFTLSYSDLNTDRYSRVGDEFRVSTTELQEWPIGTVRWRQTFRTGALAQVSVAATIRDRESSTQLPTATGVAVTATSSEAVNRDAQVGLRNGMSLRLGWNTTDQANLSNGNTTLFEQEELIGTFNYGWRLPRSISSSGRLLRILASARRISSTSCLDRPTTIECQVVTDTEQQDISLTLGTDLGDILTASLEGSYLINDVRHLNRKSSQLVLTAGLTLQLYAGGFR